MKQRLIGQKFDGKPLTASDVEIIIKIERGRTKGRKLTESEIIDFLARSMPIWPYRASDFEPVVHDSVRKPGRGRPPKVTATSPVDDMIARRARTKKIFVDKPANARRQSKKGAAARRVEGDVTRQAVALEDAKQQTNRGKLDKSAYVAEVVRKHESTVRRVRNSRAKAKD